MSFNWVKRVDWPKILLAALIYFVLAFIIRQAEAILTMNYYTDPQYFGVWSKLMMPKAGPPELSFHLTSALFTFLTGIALALFYEFIKDTLPKNKWKRGMYFGDIVVVLGLVFFALPTLLLVNLPLSLQAVWFMTSALVFYLGSAVFVKVLK